MSLTYQPCVTIIVPVYNVEPYLDKCLQSLAMQRYPAVEVILVDDGSTDGSLAKCRAFAASHPDCQVLTQPNAGQGAARNLGIDHAKGEFVCFVDGDDWIDPDLISDLVVQFDAQTDFVSFGLDFVTEQGSVSHEIARFAVERLEGAAIFEHAMLDNQVLSSPVNKIYRTRLLVDNGVRFPAVRACEDMYFSRAVAFYSTRTRFVSRAYYHALIRDGSTSRHVTMAFIRETLKTLGLEQAFLEARQSWDKYETLYCAHYIKQAAHSLVLAAFRMSDYKEYRSAVALVREQKVLNSDRLNAGLQLLGFKHRVVLSLSRWPILLRMAASGLRVLGIKPY